MNALRNALLILSLIAFIPACDAGELPDPTIPRVDPSGSEAEPARNIDPAKAEEADEKPAPQTAVFGAG